MAGKEKTQCGGLKFPLCKTLKSKIIAVGFLETAFDCATVLKYKKMKTKLIETLKNCILASVENDAINKAQELDEDFERFENTAEIICNKDSIGEVSYIAYKETFYKGRSYSYDTPPSHDEYNIEVHEIFNIKIWSESGNECKNISELLNHELILDNPIIF